MAEVFGKPAVLFQVRMAFYCLLIFFSFFIFCGIAVMKDKAYERGTGCPLYVDFEEQILAADSVCNFPLAIAIIFQLFYLLFRVASLCFDNMGKVNEENRYCLFNGCMELLYVVTELLATFFTFIGACILSAGKNSACEKSACDGQAWTSPATAAEFGSWISTLLWLATLTVSILVAYRSGKVCRGGGVKKGDAVSMQEIDDSETNGSPVYL